MENNSCTRIAGIAFLALLVEQLTLCCNSISLNSALYSDDAWIAASGDVAYGSATPRIAPGSEPRPYEIHVRL